MSKFFEACFESIYKPSNSNYLEISQFLKAIYEMSLIAQDSFKYILTDAVLVEEDLSHAKPKYYRDFYKIRKPNPAHYVFKFGDEFLDIRLPDICTKSGLNKMFIDSDLMKFYFVVVCRESYIRKRYSLYINTEILGGFINDVLNSRICEPSEILLFSYLLGICGVSAKFT